MYYPKICASYFNTCQPQMANIHVNQVVTPDLHGVTVLSMDGATQKCLFFTWLSTCDAAPVVPPKCWFTIVEVGAWSQLDVLIIC